MFCARTLMLGRLHIFGAICDLLVSGEHKNELPGWILSKIYARLVSNVSEFVY